MQEKDKCWPFNILQIESKEEFPNNKFGTVEDSEALKVSFTG